MLEGCRRALKPGGHAVFLTYSRPARVGQVFREVRARQGTASAVRALADISLLAWVRSAAVPR